MVVAIQGTGVKIILCVGLMSMAPLVALGTELHRGLAGYWPLDDGVGAVATESFGDVTDVGELLDRSAQELRFKVTDEDGDAERPGIPESLLGPTTWQHVLGVYDGNAGQAKIYLNGEVIDVHTNSTLTGLVRPGQVASIGANANGNAEPASRFFPGAIDDVAVWNRPLGRAEASYLYNSGMGTAVGAANPDLTFVSYTAGGTDTSHARSSPSLRVRGKSGEQWLGRVRVGWISDRYAGRE